MNSQIAAENSVLEMLAVGPRGRRGPPFLACRAWNDTFTIIRIAAVNYSA